MSRGLRLLRKALREPGNLRFEELCTLARQLGFRPARSRGSHHIYTREGLARPLNFQDVGGRAKPFQVRQLIEAAYELGRIDEDGEG